MLDKILFSFFVFAGFSSTFAGSTCYNHDSWEYDDDTFWCDGGCCGDIGNRYCCDYETTAVGAIVGIVIGSILCVVLVVSVVVAICCCCRRTKGRSGQVCQPVTGQTAMIQMHSYPYGQTGYNGAGNIPVTIMTSHMTPGTMQQLQQSAGPPKYEELPPN